MTAHVVVTALAALGGAAIASLLRLPAAPLLGAMLGVAALTMLREVRLEVPAAFTWCVYVAVGALLGLQVTRESLTALRAAVVPILVTVVLFLVFGLVLAWSLWKLGGLDAHTALLATAPGGIAQMGVLSAEVRANVPLVLSVHVLRITSVIVLMSVGLKLLGGRS